MNDVAYQALSIETKTHTGQCLFDEQKVLEWPVWPNPSREWFIPTISGVLGDGLSSDHKKFISYMYLICDISSIYFHTND